MFAFTPKIQQYGGGVFYEPDECVNYAFEEIPAECVVERAGRTAYTCTVNNGVDCGELLPDHCQLYLAGGPQYHAVAVIGYGEVCLGIFWELNLATLAIPALLQSVRKSVNKYWTTCLTG